MVTVTNYFHGRGFWPEQSKRSGRSHLTLLGVLAIALAALAVLVIALVGPYEVLAKVVRGGRRVLGITGHTLRIVPVLAGSRPPATGPLRVSQVNPRYFADPSGRVVFLAGDHTWYMIQNSGASDPPPAFDYGRFLDFLESNGVNFFRTFVWEQARWSEGVKTEYYYSPTLYERTGPGTAVDGKPKFDLNKLNQPYFDKLRQRVIEAGKRGIYVSVQIFQGFSVQTKPFMASNNPWPGHPFDRRNNINGINGDRNGNGEGEETETLEIPAITKLQETYVGKLVDTVNDLDNVLFEICNEANLNSNDWQEHFIRYIHEYEARKPKQHPVGRTVNWPGGTNDELFNSEAEWISPNSDGGYFGNPPAATGAKVIVNDTDHLCYPCGDREWMWKSFLRGFNPAFMDPYDCRADWSPPGCDANDPKWVSLRLNLGYALKYASRIDLEAMTPHAELASTGYCLAKPVANGAEYLVYLPLGDSVAVDLSAARGPVDLEWFGPGTGAAVNGGSSVGGATRTFTAPFRGDAVLYLSQGKAVSKQLRGLPPRIRAR